MRRDIVKTCGFKFCPHRARTSYIIPSPVVKSQISLHDMAKVNDFVDAIEVSSQLVLSSSKGKLSWMNPAELGAA